MHTIFLDDDKGCTLGDDKHRQQASRKIVDRYSSPEHKNQPDGQHTYIS